MRKAGCYKKVWKSARHHLLSHPPCARQSICSAFLGSVPNQIFGSAFICSAVQLLRTPLFGKTYARQTYARHRTKTCARQTCAWHRTKTSARHFSNARLFSFSRHFSFCSAFLKCHSKLHTSPLLPPRIHVSHSNMYLQVK